MATCHEGAHHSEAIKHDLITRLERIQGQVGGVIRMVKRDTYCDSILNQITAIRAALLAVQEKLLIEHFRTCVVEQIKNGQEEVIEELASTIRRMAR